MLRLDGRVALVTGAGSGMGRAAALAFAREGAAVVANDLDAAGLRETAAAIEADGGRVATHVGDVSVSGDVAAMVAVAVDAFGGLDVLLANAAIGLYGELAGMPEETLERILAVNLKGPLLCARAAIPAMIERGGGSIVFVSSVQGYQGLHGCSVYAAAKAGLVAAARTLSLEAGAHGIRVNALVPGTIDTPMLRRDMEPHIGDDGLEALLDRIRAANVLGRIGSADEVAAAAVFLASAESSYVTGSAIVVDGGFIAVKSV